MLFHSHISVEQEPTNHNLKPELHHLSTVLYNGENLSNYYSSLPFFTNNKAFTLLSPPLFAISKAPCFSKHNLLVQRSEFTLVLFLQKQRQRKRIGLR